MITPNSLKLSNFSGDLKKLSSLNVARLADKKLSAIYIAQICEGAKIHILSQINQRKLIIVSDNLAATSMVRKLKSWGVKADYVPYRDDVLIPRKTFSLKYVKARMRALSLFAAGEIDTLVASAEALLQFFPKEELIVEYSTKVKVEDIISPQTIADNLSKAGYIRQELIAEEGEFSIRGDILDVYSIDGKAYRINFFDELVESIKEINIETMKSIEEVDSILVPPATDILLDESTYALAKGRLGKHLENKYVLECLENLRVGACAPSTVWAIPFMMEANSSLIEFVSNKYPLIVFDEPKVIKDKIDILTKEFTGRYHTLFEGGEILEEHNKASLTLDDVKKQWTPLNKLALSYYLSQNPMFTATCLIQPKTRQVTKYYLDPQSVKSDLKVLSRTGVKAVFACGDLEKAKNWQRNLISMDIASELSMDGNSNASVCVTPLSIETGVIYPDEKVWLIGTSECIGKSRQESIKSQKAQFIAPKEGDYVVHKIHGVGLCAGTQMLKNGDIEKEYVVIKYRDGGTLYVATDQMDNLQKFIGNEKPTLNKLGGKDFEREKEKVRKSVKKLAINLVEIYAQREQQKGYKYSTDTIWQKEFEDSFEYEETPDQIKAIADIKNDMESGKIMDRLLVGDVGFGKTEVAFRAMFKTVLDNKQAVLLAPTTILARQHYENLVPRLKEYGIRCGLLTRLQTKKDNGQLLQDIKDGKVHMVIATHMVLSKNVEFKDLGLLVLDEEQRFGVAHKELLKEKHPLVNVLTLSATPIPRTLNMSLTGIRDISMLETPPIGRLPVQTYVVDYSDSLCVDAITREAARDGQTLILCNNIEHLDMYAERFRNLCGDNVKILTAHGQLAPQDLESRISAFYEKKYNVLIATTIIENGIDLPDANTLIVIDSGHFGLSQLYQLRGRVGRRGLLAHAYFTLPPNSSVTEDASKRLNTLLENTEIGSGFKVALADLSIRGAGNILGAEQSGHIERVGYEMYLELLNDAIQEIKTGIPVKHMSNVEMKVDASAYIRNGYVSAKDKIRIYKRIALVSSVTERDELLSEINDIYGPVDQPLRNLIDVALLKNLTGSFGVTKVIINRNGAGVNFQDASVYKNEQLIKAVADQPLDVVLTSSIPPSLVFNVKGLKVEQIIEKMVKFFASI